MFTPKGEPANKTDKVILLGMWAKFLAKSQKKKPKEHQAMIYAGMGKPTHPLHPDTKKFLAEYWRNHDGRAIDYGDPQGDSAARTLMASAMSDWYGVPLEADEILFNVGGSGALNALSAALKNYFADLPNFRVITPYPYYTLYANNGLNLHPVGVMNNLGYRLSAQSLSASIDAAEQLAKSDKAYPRVILLCEPNNPLGSVLSEDDLRGIAALLRRHLELIIVLDEVYAEMVLDGSKHVSLLSIAPDLKNRIVIMRSATKGLSAAGERMAITITGNKALMTFILEHSIRHCGHAPRSLQMAYAKTMESFTEVSRIQINTFYRQRVEYVNQRLRTMGASMPDKYYRVAAGFYILGDFSDLLGGPIAQSATQALGTRQQIKSDEDIAYDLLFTNQVMLAPGSYFGLPKKSGYLRITCSASMSELKQLMDRLEERLRQARLIKRKQFQTLIEQKITTLTSTDPVAFLDIKKRCQQIDLHAEDALALKTQNGPLKAILMTVQGVINQSTRQGINKAATEIQAHWRGFAARKSTLLLKQEQDKKWHEFISFFSPKPSTFRNRLENFSITQRLDLEPWKEYLAKTNNHVSASFWLNALVTNQCVLYSFFALIFLAAASIAALLSLTSICLLGAALGGFWALRQESQTQANANKTLPRSHY